MAIDEIERNALVNTLITTLGEDPAATLMKTVWPQGTDNLATKDDLHKFATKDDLHKFATKDDLRALEERMHAYVDSAIARQTRTIMLTMAGFMTALMAPLYAGLLA